jgi:DNA-binding HxlR family transcriptional regulator
MSGYGQFCPIALATEVIAERWTPLVLRELMLGATRFNDIHRGVPRMSPSLLSRRLRSLEAAGIVERRSSEGRLEYHLTKAGNELTPTIESLATWSKRWLPATLSQDRADPDLVMWDMHRRMDRQRMPAARTVIRFEFSDQPVSKRMRWILGSRDQVDLCITDPGLEPDLFVVTESRVMIWIWYGDIALKEAICDGRLRLHGPRKLCEAFPSWLQLSLIAGIPRRVPTI